MISLESRPRLAAKARLRWDRKDERFMLLYPERGLVLMAAKYTRERDAVEREVVEFLTRMAERGLIANGDE